MKINQLAKLRMGYTFRTSIPACDHGNVKVVQSKNITSDGRMVFDEDEPARVDMKPPSPLVPGEVLVVNRAALAAAVFYQNDEFIWLAASSLLVLSVDTSIAFPEYVALYLNSAQGHRLFERYQETTTVPFVSLKNLGRMNIPIPPLERQKTLVAFEAENREFHRLATRKLKLRRSILDQQLQTIHHEENEGSEE